MRLYFELARQNFRRQMAYRAANWAGFATNTFFGCLRSYVFVALFAARPEVVGYNLADALNYVWLTQALLMFTYMWGWWEISETIRTGQIATDLAKPVDYFCYWLGRDVGRAAYHLLFRGLPTYAAGVILFGASLPSSPTVWLWFALSLILSELVSFGIRFITNVITFWTVDTRGIGIIVGIASSFFGGLLIPNAFFPDWLKSISDVLPFQALLFVPSSIFLGKLQGEALLMALGQQALWVVALMAIGRGLLALATRRLVLQGG